MYLHVDVMEVDPQATYIGRLCELLKEVERLTNSYKEKCQNKLNEANQIIRTKHNEILKLKEQVLKKEEEMMLVSKSGRGIQERTLEQNRHLKAELEKYKAYRVQVEQKMRDLSKALGKS